MNSGSIFQRRIMNLDFNVWLVMLSIIILSIAFYGYRTITRKEDKACIDMPIFIKGQVAKETQTYYLNDLLGFGLPVGAQDQVVWDFGDRTANGTGALIQHMYQKEGRFNIKATVNKRCFFETVVIIQKRSPVNVADDGVKREPIVGLDMGDVGDRLMFSTELTAESFEWYIDNDPNYKRQNGSSVEYTFKSPKTYTVVLNAISGEKISRYTKQVIITRNKEDRPVEILKIEAPEPDTPVAVVAPPPVNEPEPEPKKPDKLVINDVQMKHFLQLMVCERMLPSDFDKYLCTEGNTMVTANKKRMTFADFCKMVKGKKVKIDHAQIIISDKCTENITINYDEKSKLLGKNPCKD